MSLMQNPFVNQEEVIFITYDEVIKNPYPLLLHEAVNKYHESYEDYLDMDRLRDINVPNLDRLCIQREKKNVFEEFAKTKFDYAGSLKELKNKDFNLYERCELYAMGKQVKMLASQKFTKKIYLYTEEYDIRIHLDIQNTFIDMEKINYVCGDFQTVFMDLEKITTFIINDIDYLPVIFETGNADYASILLASYGYNFKLDKEDSLITRLPIEDEYMKNTVCKFATFIPLEMSPENFNCMG